MSTEASFLPEFLALIAFIVGSRGCNLDAVIASRSWAAPRGHPRIRV
jgi:hypothetical protein